MTYKIVRKHFDMNHPDHNKLVASGLTLEEAQEHCSDESTHEKGIWMDVFYEDVRGHKPPSFMGTLLALQTRNPDKHLRGC